jgi:hypothetical protein
MQRSWSKGDWMIGLSKKMSPWCLRFLILGPIWTAFWWIRSRSLDEQIAKNHAKFINTGDIVLIALLFIVLIPCGVRFDQEAGERKLGPFDFEGSTAIFDLSDKDNDFLWIALGLGPILLIELAIRAFCR